jgi:hypothetical protein
MPWGRLVTGMLVATLGEPIEAGHSQQAVSEIGRTGVLEARETKWEEGTSN